MTKSMNVCLALACFLALSINLVSGADKKSECQIQREKQEALVKNSGSAAIPVLVPRCNSDGSYAQLQCHHNSNFCQCWDPQGNVKSAPKVNLTKCNCLISRADEMAKLNPRDVGHKELTSCERDGSYSKRQCGDSTCWCVNPETGAKLGNESRDKNSVKC